MVKILALNGGGTAGYATSIYLASLEAALQKPVAQVFDLIVGVSTGAIQAIALGSGMPARSLVRVYEHEMPAVFHKDWWAPWRGTFIGTMYKRDRLTDLLRTAVPTRLLSGMNTHVMVYATELNPQIGAKFWKSWRSEDGSINPINIALASCAAPGYFGTYRFGDGVYADGGLVANNPSVPAIAEALRLGFKQSEIKVLNLQPKSGKSWSDRHARRMKTFLRWAPVIADVMIDAGQQSTSYIATQLLGERFMQVNLGIEGDLDAWSGPIKAKMEDVAGYTWRTTGDRVIANFVP